MVTWERAAESERGYPGERGHPSERGHLSECGVGPDAEQGGGVIPSSDLSDDGVRPAHVDSLALHVDTDPPWRVTGKRARRRT